MLRRFSRNHPLLVRFSVYVVVPLLALLLLGHLQLRRSLPVEEGGVSVPGLTQPVDIVSDAGGVAHIFAGNDADAFFTLGYVHAQNRLWQMEYQRRLGQGRLSELVGRSLLQTDKFMRTLGLPRVVERNLERLDPGARSSLEAYASGVNAWLAQRHALPIEFQFLGFEPEPWRVQDSLLQIKLLALSLDRNYRDDLAFSLFASMLGPEKANQIRTAGPLLSDGRSGLIQQDVAARMLAWHESMDAMFGLSGEGAGSNAWVVAGRYTSTGKPLLANDPHLRTQIPSIFYLAELRGDKLHVTGATIPGIPLVLSGHNDSIAWGITALYADTQDLFVERAHVTDDSLYEVDGAWQPMQVEEELIQVRADFPSFLNEPLAPVRWPVRTTRHGPLISDALGEVRAPMALKWAALQDTDGSYAAFLGINYARDWPGFTQSLRNYTAPTLNFVYADQQGNIGHVAAGQVPIRKSGDGSLPVAGWASEFEWVGFIPGDELPHTFNPASGYLVTANNQAHDAGYQYFMARDWAPGYRAQRITELLSDQLRSGEKMTTRDFVRIQGDKKNLQAGQLLRLFKSLTGADERQKEALQYLRDWDLQADESSVAASVYHAWSKHFSRSILEQAMKADVLYGQRGQAGAELTDELYPLFLNEVVNGAWPDWCDDPATAAVESCGECALAALPAALQELERVGGGNMSSWRWGRLHKARYPHPLFTHIKPLDVIFDRSIANGGDTYTVNPAPTTFSKDKGYEQVGGASYRQVIDLAEWNDSRFLNSTGQSGNPFSRHYADNIRRHQQLSLSRMSFGAASVQGRTLILVPARQDRASGT